MYYFREYFGRGYDVKCLHTSSLEIISGSKAFVASDQFYFYANDVFIPIGLEIDFFPESLGKR